MTTFSDGTSFYIVQHVPTYESDEPGYRYVRTCHTCGALVDDAAKETHVAFHAGTPAAGGLNVGTLAERCAALAALVTAAMESQMELSRIVERHIDQPRRWNASPPSVPF